MTDVEAELNKIFREVFGSEGICIYPEMTANDVSGWDSFSHMTLIVAIEARFNITFTRKEAMSFNCVGDLIKCIERKIQA